MATHHIKVTGKVQGVFYRATAKKMALASGLVGWIRNTNDEDVEILITGEDEKLQAFEAWCRIGPAQAKVEDVIVTPVDDIAFDDFRIVR